MINFMKIQFMSYLYPGVLTSSAVYPVKSLHISNLMKIQSIKVSH